MTSMPSVNSAALLILQQASVTSATGEKPHATDTLVATANGVGGRISSTQQPTQVQSHISEAIFSVNHENVNKQKLDLIDRAGKALGIDQKAYDTRDEFVDAMQAAFGKFKMEGGVPLTLERQLGLDKLGVSFQDLIDSARDPEANDKLTKALEKQQLKAQGDDRSQGFLTLTVQHDAIGLYRPFGQ